MKPLAIVLFLALSWETNGLLTASLGPSRGGIKKLQLDFNSKPEITVHTNNLIKKVTTNIEAEVVIEHEVPRVPYFEQAQLVSSPDQQGRPADAIAGHPVYFHLDTQKVLTYEGKVLQEPSLERGPSFKRTTFGGEGVTATRIPAFLLTPDDMQELAHLNIDFDNVNLLQSDISRAIARTSEEHVMFDPEIIKVVDSYVRYMIFLQQKARGLSQVPKYKLFPLTQPRKASDIKFQKTLFTANSLDRSNNKKLARPRRTEDVLEKSSAYPSNYESIPKVLLLLERISNQYTNLFNGLPRDKEEITSTAKGDLDQAMVLYKKLRTFITSLSVVEYSLRIDVRTALNFINSIPISSQSLIEFFELSQSFNSINLSEKSLSQQYERYSALLSGQLDAVSTSLRSIARSLEDLLLVQESIDKHVEYMRKNMDNSALMNDETRVDASATALIFMVDHQKEVENDLQVSIGQLDSVGQMKETIRETLMDLSDSANGVSLEAQENSSKVLATIGLVFLAFAL